MAASTAARHMPRRRAPTSRSVRVVTPRILREVARTCFMRKAVVACVAAAWAAAVSSCRWLSWARAAASRDACWMSRSSFVRRRSSWIWGSGGVRANCGWSGFMLALRRYCLNNHQAARAFLQVPRRYGSGPASNDLRARPAAHLRLPH